MGDDPYLPELTHEAVSRGNGSAATGGSSLTVHQGLSSGAQLFVVVTACLALGLSVGAVVIAAMSSQNDSRTEREVRMLEYYLLELDAKAIAAGIKRPEEAIADQLKESKK